MKSKTVATWLAFIGGPLGLHRFYLHGWRDPLGWALPVPSLLGLYGIWRVRQWGLDDQWSWWLMPLLGFNFAGCALTAIVYGLTASQQWNGRFNSGTDTESSGGNTTWLTIGAVIMALLVGTTVLMSAIAFSFQRVFEYQAIQATKSDP